ncbi:MAG TPA: hypothetical protein DCF68_05835 [Cyanothece sp. UBA12306]|nr:hypothetical protein [Cyanothece sp. UBA12306]
MTTQTLTRSSAQTRQNSISESNKSYLSVNKPYQAVQQLKYLHLELEIDVLLQELQTIKQNKQNSV